MTNASVPMAKVPTASSHKTSGMVRSFWTPRSLSPSRRPRQMKLGPYLIQGPAEPDDLLLGVPRRGRHPQPLGPLRHRRCIHWLDVDPVPLRQPRADRLALVRIADQHRKDVAVL